MGFCLVAQPWRYKKIGGPSKLTKDFPWPIPNHSGPPQQLLYDRSLRSCFKFLRAENRELYKYILNFLISQYYFILRIFACSFEILTIRYSNSFGIFWDTLYTAIAHRRANVLLRLTIILRQIAFLLNLLIRNRLRTEYRTTWSKTCIQGRRIKATLLRKLELRTRFLMHSTHA